MSPEAVYKNLITIAMHFLSSSDLAIALRKRLGHWFRVVELLKQSASTTDSQVKQAYSNIGDYYIDRQNWLVLSNVFFLLVFIIFVFRIVF